MSESQVAPEKIDNQRRSALLHGASAAILAVAPALLPTPAQAASENDSAPETDPGPPPSAAAAGNRVVPTAEEPRHHVVMQNSQMRVMRVMIRPGESTMWHAQNLTFVNTIVNGSRAYIQRKDEHGGKVVDMKTGSVRFGDYQTSGIVDQVSNIGDALIHQIAFEVIALERGNYGNADRSGVSAFSLVLDKARVRGWRLRLQPGEIAAPYRQFGPGLRVVLSGERLIEQSPGDIGKQTTLHKGDAFFTEAGTRVLTNGGETPLEVMEYELL
ncbi:cupin domain-containing protein [Paraburkholderia sp. BCC1886]|uniref:cupin domain-containing protein n=1 Tax=Paraburkholderia sp. BCC1886 TaxID=2562670 RepID=UPI00118343E8|nr:cupin domain-containing protein [Paraburkholderia sp. BCC1886]